MKKLQFNKDNIWNTNYSKEFLENIDNFSWQQVKIGIMIPLFDNFLYFVRGEVYVFVDFPNVRTTVKFKQFNSKQLEDAYERLI